jgi:hypothetical protein
MLKRLMCAAALILSAGAVATFAQHDSDQINIRPRDFTLPTDRGPCSQLPDGLVVQGHGTERTWIEIDNDGEGDGDDRQANEGRPTQHVSTKITGTATDNQGGTYTFSYSNRFETPLPGPGIMVDRFAITGRGAANGLSTFFRARVTADSTGNLIAFEILRESGDPFGCDGI